MGTVTIIVIGVVAISVIGILGDIVTKIVQARSNRWKQGVENRNVDELAGIKQRVSLLEARLEEREDAVRKLQDEVRFVSRMLEDKTSPQARP